ncbi:MAG TPA: response regulator transcription factor [Acidobacteriota bacterium]|nr:response regulator transcription factor [Acidobacteriota bacterium]
MADATRLLIVAENQLFRESLAAVLARSGGRMSIEAASDKSEALRHLERFNPNVLLIDVTLDHSGAIELTEEISRQSQETHVILLGIPNSTTEIIRCVEAGARGFVSRNGSIDDIRQLIDRVLQGETVCSPEIAHDLFARLTELAHERRRREPADSANLTPRELEVLQLIAEGMSNKEIASELYLSLHTVKNHVHNILTKLKVRHRTEAIKYAFERKWIRRKGNS